MTKPQLPYGLKTDYPKIDIYVRPRGGKFVYAASTIWARTCSEAAKRYAVEHGFHEVHVMARFAK